MTLTEMGRRATAAPISEGMGLAIAPDGVLVMASQPGG